MLKVVLSALAFVLTPSVTSADRLPIPVKWASKLGVLYITTIQGNGLFAGQYESFGFGCFGVFNVAGRVAYNRIVFTVNFDRCGSMVTWDGLIEEAGLATNWWLIFTDPTSGQQKTRKGNDLLTPVP